MAGDEPLLKMCGTVPGHVHAVILYSLNTFSLMLMEGNSGNIGGLLNTLLLEGDINGCVGF